MDEREPRQNAAKEGSPWDIRMTRRHLLRTTGLGAAGVMMSGAVLAACSKKAATGTTSPSGGSPLNVGFAYIGPVTDNGWTFTHDEGRKAVVAKFGSRVNTSFVENVPISAEASQTFEQLASKNDLVIANTEYANFLSDVAVRHPDVKFMECDGHTFSSNEFAYYVAHQYPAYLLGVAAGMLAKNGKIGYVGAFPSATTFNDVNPILLGARTINPSATVQSVLISSFFDPQKATQATNALIDGGAQFIFSVMDEPSFLQVCQKKGVWGAAWNTDIRKFGPDVYVNTYDLTPAWEAYYTEEIQKALDGSWQADSEVKLLSVDLGEWGDKVPSDVQDKVAAAKAQIDGGFNPYTGPITDTKGAVRVKEGEQLSAVQAYSIDWAVEGVSGAS